MRVNKNDDGHWSHYSLVAGREVAHPNRRRVCSLTAATVSLVPETTTKSMSDFPNGIFTFCTCFKSRFRDFKTSVSKSQSRSRNEEYTMGTNNNTQNFDNQSEWANNTKKKKNWSWPDVPVHVCHADVRNRYMCSSSQVLTHWARQQLKLCFIKEKVSLPWYVGVR